MKRLGNVDYEILVGTMLWHRHANQLKERVTVSEAPEVPSEQALPEAPMGSSNSSLPAALQGTAQANPNAESGMCRRNTQKQTFQEVSHLYRKFSPLKLQFQDVTRRGSGVPPQGWTCSFSYGKDMSF